MGIQRQGLLRPEQGLAGLPALPGCLAGKPVSRDGSSGWAGLRGQASSQSCCVQRPPLEAGHRQGGSLGLGPCVGIRGLPGQLLGATQAEPCPQRRRPRQDMAVTEGLAGWSRPRGS